MRICSWRLLEQGKWREAGDLAARIAPFEHSRRPQSVLIQHAGDLAATGDAPVPIPLPPGIPPRTALLPPDPAVRLTRPDLSYGEDLPTRAALAMQEREAAERDRHAAIRSTMDAHLAVVQTRRAETRLALETAPAPSAVALPDAPDLA